MFKDLSLESKSIQTQKCAPIQCTVWHCNGVNFKKKCRTFFMASMEACICDFWLHILINPCLDYERLKTLNLSSLEYRRKRGTMIEMYKTCYGFYDRNATAELFERNDKDSRGNACKVVVCKANLEIRKNFFTIRAPLDWNNLPQKTVQSMTIDELKWKLNKHWKAIGIDMYDFERR